MELIPQSRVVVQSNQKGLRFYVDKKKAVIVFDKMIARLKSQGPPYNKAKVPQADLPHNLTQGTKEHAVFLFVLCFWMRGGVESDTATLLLKVMYEERPDVFNPELYIERKGITNDFLIQTISEVLMKYKLGQRVEENAPGWVYNMRKLARHWEGDPRKLFADRPKFKVMAKRIIGKTAGKNGEFKNEDKPYGFMFFRQKMTSMIAYFLMDAKLIPMFYTPVPVDFHVLRLLTTTEILGVRKMDTEERVGVDFYKTASPPHLARRITEWYCRKYQISPLALCDALWLLSRSLCRKNPGNTSNVFDPKRKEKKLKEEPNATFAFPEDADEDEEEEKNIEAILENSDQVVTLKGRKRYLGLKYSPEELQSERLMEKFKKSCGLCPVNADCRYNISSGAYYVAGMLLPERLRVIPVDSQHHFLAHPAFVGSESARLDPGVRFSEIVLLEEHTK